MADGPIPRKNSQSLYVAYEVTKFSHSFVSYSTSFSLSCGEEVLPRQDQLKSEHTLITCIYTVVEGGEAWHDSVLISVKHMSSHAWPRDGGESSRIISDLIL